MKKRETQLIDLSRIVYAPEWDTFTGTAVKSVVLRPDEQVIWTYSYNAKGVKFVSGYTIVKKNG